MASLPTELAARALHYVFRVGSRQASYDFYVKQLGMKILRHEEFKEGCKASCNGPYDGAWSKTMVGYGGEDEHFVLELTYNYGQSSYKLGNDYKGIYIESDTVLEKVKNSPKVVENGVEFCSLRDPDGHNFYVKKSGDSPFPVTKVAINVRDLKESKEFWHDLLVMGVEFCDDKGCTLSYGENQCKLELLALASGEKLERGTAYGRIAFMCPADKLKPLEAKVKNANAKFIHTPHKALDTPGKATVEVVIVQDPNGHEICFVGSEAFLELSKIDPNAEKLFNEALEDEKKWNEK